MEKYKVVINIMMEINISYSQIIEVLIGNLSFKKEITRERLGDYFKIRGEVIFRNSEISSRYKYKMINE